MTEGPTHEIELKLGVPRERAAQVLAAVQGRNGATRTHLQASYYDTPSHDLAAAGMGWRVRREGRRWVQTLKAQLPHGGDGLRREEHNVVVHGRTRPIADAELHASTPAGELLAATLQRADEPASERFSTDVWRDSRQVRVRGGTIELAFDKGSVSSGERSLPVLEAEIELMRGSTTAVIDTARQLVERHGLWLDAGTKAQRGVMLSKGLAEAPLVKAPEPALTRRMSPDAAVREMMRACLVQITGNASSVAAGLGGHEHVHQTRVGVRKLRTVLRVFGDLSPGIDPTWADRLATVFDHLGANRDRDVVLATWVLELADAGAPDVIPPAVDAVEPSLLLRTPEVSLLWLELLAHVHGAAATDESGGDLRDVVAKRLSKLHRRALADAKHFARLAPERQHSVRKRMKRLRYVAELTAALYPSKKVTRFVQELAPAQEALGQLNDIGVAAEMFRAMTDVDGAAWFAVGWLSSRRDEAVAACHRPLRDAAKAATYWK